VSIDIVRVFKYNLQITEGSTVPEFISIFFFTFIVMKCNRPVAMMKWILAAQWTVSVTQLQPNSVFLVQAALLVLFCIIPFHFLVSSPPRYLCIYVPSERPIQRNGYDFGVTKIQELVSGQLSYV
jgi:hypothetical protein